MEKSIIDFGDGYLSAAGPNKPMSLMEICELNPAYFHSRGNGRYLKEKFAHEDKVDTGRIIIRNGHVSGSTNRGGADQIELLFANEYVPNVAVVVWVLSIYYAVRGIYLLPHICVRTSSFDDYSHPVVVGDSYDGIIIRSWKGNPDGMIGVISAVQQ